MIISSQLNWIPKYIYPFHKRASVPWSQIGIATITCSSQLSRRSNRQPRSNPRVGLAIRMVKGVRNKNPFGGGRFKRTRTSRESWSPQLNGAVEHWAPRLFKADEKKKKGKRKKKKKNKEAFSTWEFQYCHQLLYYLGSWLLNCLVPVG